MTFVSDADRRKSHQDQEKEGFFPDQDS